MIVKVLIIDDHELVRAGIRLILHDIEPTIKLFEAASVAQGMLEIQREPTLDAVIMGLALQKENSLSSLKQINHMADCQLVVISPDKDQAIIERAIPNSAITFIPKSSEASFIHRQLKTVVDQCIDQLKSNPRPDVKSTAKYRHMGGYVPRVELTEDMIDIINNLTRRQKEVLELLAAGKTNKQICATLGLSDGTVKNHVTAILSMFGVNRRTKAALLAREYESKRA